jgi:uncharacterized protein (DUF2147 family)
MHKLLITLTLALAGTTAFAQATPAGVWRTIDDETKKERSTVRITETGGVFTGKIEKLADPTRQEAVCDQCTDARKGQKVIGMTIIQGVKKGDSADLFEGGEILDPNNGKTYRVRMTLKDGGKTMEVRGFIGTPMLGRTQVWQRVE